MTRPATFGLTVKFDKIQAADREESSGVSDHNPLATVEHGHTLAEAIVDTIREPLVVLDRDLRVIAASRSFYRTFEVEPRNTQAKWSHETRKAESSTCWAMGSGTSRLCGLSSKR